MITAQEILMEATVSIASMDLQNQIYDKSENPLLLYSANTARGIAILCTAYGSVKMNPEDKETVNGVLKDVAGMIFGIFLSKDNEDFLASVLKEEIFLTAKETSKELASIPESTDDVKESVDALMEMEKKLKNEDS